MSPDIAEKALIHCRTGGNPSRFSVCVAARESARIPLRAGCIIGGGRLRSKRLNRSQEGRKVGLVAALMPEEALPLDAGGGPPLSWDYPRGGLWAGLRAASRTRTGVFSWFGVRTRER